METKHLGKSTISGIQAKQKKNCPKKTRPKNWVRFADFTYTEEVKASRERNKINWSKMMEVDPTTTRSDSFLVGHTRSDGTFPAVLVAEKVDPDIKAVSTCSDLLTELAKMIQLARYEYFIILLAQAYMGYILYLLAFVDFRGRIYRAGVLHFHERDLSRSLLRFFSILNNKDIDISTTNSKGYLRVAATFKYEKFTSLDEAFEWHKLNLPIMNSSDLSLIELAQNASESFKFLAKEEKEGYTPNAHIAMKVVEKLNSKNQLPVYTVHNNFISSVYYSMRLPDIFDKLMQPNNLRKLLEDLTMDLGKVVKISKKDLGKDLGKVVKKHVNIESRKDKLLTITTGLYSHKKKRRYCFPVEALKRILAFLYSIGRTGGACLSWSGCDQKVYTEYRAFEGINYGSLRDMVTSLRSFECAATPTIIVDRSQMSTPPLREETITHFLNLHEHIVASGRALVIPGYQESEEAEYEVPPVVGFLTFVYAHKGLKMIPILGYVIPYFCGCL
ncbi:hypothetical protein GIB67_020869 [Kingdonia uniflora]|uniref:Uncharacterized protein n=1 Tax=Kingdonia uniflora TaxID=39325 RepID=A0A7J7M7E2_9MAGN|nr:hypothetical protein GIB67_020869 [Kingdonia uniflora]